MDGSIGALDALDMVTQSVKVREAQNIGKFTVLFDSGIRTGSDVLKALALGAQAVFSVSRTFLDPASHRRCYNSSWSAVHVRPRHCRRSRCRTDSDADHCRLAYYDGPMWVPQCQGRYGCTRKHDGQDQVMEERVV